MTGDSHSEHGAGTFTTRIAAGLLPDDTGIVQVTVSVDLHPDLRELTLTAPDRLAVQGLTGFEQSGTQFAWDGSTPAPSLAFRIAADRTDASGFRFVDRGDWAILTYPRFGSSWRYVGSALDCDTEYRVEGAGVTSTDGSIAYLGPHEEFTSRAGGQTLRLIVPRAARPQFEPDRVLSSLSSAARHLRVGGRTEEVLVLAAPSGVDWGPEGLQRGASGFWATDTCGVDSVQSTWLHEYVHTRQEWDPVASTKWLVEGTTEYYAALLTFHQGRVSFDEFHRHVSTDRDRGSVLANPEQWTRKSSHYTKGRRVLAAFDAKIRSETGHAKRFEDVFRELNAVEGDLSQSALRSTVAGTVGEACAAWLEDVVRSRTLPTVPRDERLFRDGEPAPTGTGGTAETEPAPDGTDGGDCPVCGASVDESPYCNTCGTSLDQHCPVCGREVHDERYCPECGTALQSA